MAYIFLKIKFFALILFTLLFSFNQETILVLIPTSSITETKEVFLNNTLAVHFYNDNFAIASLKGKPKNNYILLDKNPWEENYEYYIVFIDETVPKNQYLGKIESTSEVLFNGDNFLIVKTNETQYGQLPPAKNDGMVRIFKSKASLAAPILSYYIAPSSPDPFVSDLMGQVSGPNITSSARHLENYGTRDAYSTQSVDAQIWISSSFQSMGLDVEEMNFYMPGGAASDNVIATHKGTEYPDEIVVVGGHYDSINRNGQAPGADDNASGTAAVIEIARILSQVDFPRSIIFCAFSGEEYGLYGSAAYAQRSRQQELNIVGYINLDMIGYLKPGNTMQTTLIYPQSAKPLADFYTSICSLYLPNFIVQSGSLVGGDSDHTSFNNNGYLGIFPFENIDAYSPYIHTSNDIIGPSYNNEQQAVIFTKAALASVVTLAMKKNTSVSSSKYFAKIYPNPANEHVRIVLQNDNEVQLEVTNQVGQIIKSQSIYQNETIVTSSWAKGIYIFNLSSKNYSASKRVVIQ